MPCTVCHIPTPPRTVYCPRHRRFGLLAADDQSLLAIRLAMQESWNGALDGFTCFYCGVLLDEKNPKSPDYACFDHFVPGEKRLVLCSKRCNSMKNALTGPEFLKIIPALADHWESGVPFDKNIATFDKWDWKRLGLSRPMPPHKVAPFEARIKKYTDCIVCHDVLFPRSRYCARCRRFITAQHDNAVKAAAMIDAWDPVLQGFRCRYTGVILDEIDWRGPWYINFDHLVPGKPGLAVTSAWSNRMKGDMTERMFRAVVPALANHIRTGARFNKAVVSEGGFRPAPKRLSLL